MTSVVSGLTALALLLTCPPSWAGQVVRSVSGGRDVVTLVDHGSPSRGPALRARSSARSVSRPAEPAAPAEQVAASPTASVDIMAQTATSMLAHRLAAGPDIDLPDVAIDPTAYDLRVLGAAPNEASRQALAALALAISGAPTVRNELESLSTWEPSVDLVFDDAHVQERVELALLSWPELHAADIRVEVDKGVTTLTGSVATADHRTLASTAAASAAGVYLVQNRLGLLP